MDTTQLKPVITEDQLDGTMKTLLMVILTTCEQNHVPIHPDALQLMIVSGLYEQISQEGIKRLFARYITFEPEEEES